MGEDTKTYRKNWNKFIPCFSVCINKELQLQHLVEIIILLYFFNQWVGKNCTAPEAFPDFSALYTPTDWFIISIIRKLGINPLEKVIRNTFVLHSLFALKTAFRHYFLLPYPKIAA